MFKKKFICICTIFLFMIGLFNITYGVSEDDFHQMEAFAVPEKDINLNLNNLTRGCEVYLLLPTDLLKYNMEKFINNNLENEFETEREIAEDLKEILDEEDYLEYIEYFVDTSYDIEKYEMELRHYCFALGDAEVIGYLDYNNSKYVQIKINLNEENKFKIIMKDYFVNTDCSGIKFLINEYNTLTYISVSDYPLVQNAEKSSIDEYNIVYEYKTLEDYESIEKSIKIGYIIIWVVVIFTILGIIIHEIRKAKKKQKEREEILFWNKTKKQLKEEKKKLKQEKKEKKKKK